MLTFPNTDTSLHQVTYQTNATLYKTKPNTDEETKTLQKRTHTILTGIENQLLDFKHFATPVLSNSNNWCQSFGKTERSLKNLKELNGYQEKDKLDLTTELNKFYNGLKGRLEHFNDLKQELDKASTSEQQTALQEKFTIRSNAFKKNKTEILICLENSKIKLNKLKLKIEKDNFFPILDQTQLNSFIYWMRNDVPDYTITQATDTSLKDAQLRVKNSNELEAAIKKTMLQFNDVVNLEENLKLTLEAIPINLKEKQQALSNMSESLNTSKHILDQLNVEIFSKDFNDLADKRDLTCFYKILEDCKKGANGMTPFHAPLAEINNEFLAHNSSEASESKDDFSNKIKNAVKNISLKINDLNMSMNENLGDKEFGKLLKSQKQAAISHLQTLQGDIIIKYNSYRMELNNVNYHFLVFNRLINTKAKLVRLYLDTETIRSTMRDTRKRKNSTRNEHEKIYAIYKPKFDEIRKSILLENKEPLFYDSFSNQTLTSVDYSSRMIFTETPLAPTLSTQISQLNHDDNIYFNSQAKINSLIASDQFNDPLAEQIQILKTHLAIEKEKIHKAYTVTLKNMCLMAKEEINLMGKALTYIPDKYDNDFTSAYTYKNAMSKQLQEKIESYKGTYGEYEEYTFPSESDFLAQNTNK